MFEVNLWTWYDYWVKIISFWIIDIIDFVSLTWSITDCLSSSSYLQGAVIFFETWQNDSLTDWLTDRLIEWQTNWLSDLPTNWLPTRIWCLITTERRGFFVWQTIAKNSSSLHFIRDIFREKSWIIHWLIILLNNHIMFISLYVKLSSRILKIVLENLVEVHHCLYSFRSKDKMMIKRKQTEGWCLWSSTRKWQSIIQEGKQN